MGDMIIPGEVVINDAAKKFKTPDLLNWSVEEFNLKWGNTSSGRMYEHIFCLA